jgi:uncharacterized membrane protein YeaQ/YmgE (transglycosylase-associated protein family)
MNMILSALLGGLVGWALTALMPGGRRPLNVVTGVVTGMVGALLAGWSCFSLVHTSWAHESGIGTTASLVSILGAALACGLASLARRGVLR